MKTILNTLDYTLHISNNVHHHTKPGYSCSLLFDYARFQSKKLHHDMFLGEKALFANFEVNKNDDIQLSLIRTDSEHKEPVLFFNETYNLYPKVCSNSTGDYGLVFIKTVADLVFYFPDLKPTQLFLELLNDRNLSSYCNLPLMSSK